MSVMKSASDVHKIKVLIIVVSKIVVIEYMIL